MLSQLLALILSVGASPPGSPAGAEPGWRQVLSVPRVGGRLRSMAIDRKNPDRLFVGTEEGTILRSLDRGVTWDEIDLRTRVVMDRSLGLKAPGLPRLGKVTKSNFRTIVDPPGRTVTDRITIPSVADPFPIRPEFFFAGFLATSKPPRVKLLYDVVSSRWRETIPIKRIVICEGGVYPLIVASSTSLYGSTDDGLTYVRMFANPGRTTISNVACNPTDPMQIAVATGIGLFTSKDGGLTFDQDLTAWPGQRATAVSFGPSPASEATRLYSASGSELFAGDPDSEEGLTTIYPNDPKTAPWLSIRWIASTPQGLVWLATDDGARVSFDHGSNWETAARTLLSRQAIKQVEIGLGERGQTRVAMVLNVRPRSIRGKYVSGLQDSVVYASDDGGKSFFPFFAGFTRRTFRRVFANDPGPDHPAGWWVLTSNELWTTIPPKSNTPRIDNQAINWAKSRLRKTPRIDIAINAVLDRTGLSNEKIHHLAVMHRSLNYVPRFDLKVAAGNLNHARIKDVQFGRANANRLLIHRIAEGTNTTDFLFFAQASWDLLDVVRPFEDLNSVRRAMHWLRREIAFAAEDAWHERANHLKTLAQGLSDPVQVESLKIRVEVLEAMFAVWLREDLGELSP